MSKILAALVALTLITGAASAAPYGFPATTATQK